MKTIERVAAKSLSRLILFRLVMLCVFTSPLTAKCQSSQQAPGATVTAPAASLPAGTREVITLDGPWRFQQGDDLRWADPAFDDSNWSTVVLGQSLAAQGYESYTGYAWYRMRIDPRQLSRLADPNGSTALLVTGNSVGQISVFVNGNESGHTRGMTEPVAEYQSPPFVVPISLTGTAPIVLAIRTAAGPKVNIQQGLLDKIELGKSQDITDRLAMGIGRQWDEHVTVAIILAFLFLGVAQLGAALYLAQRNHSEYLWLTILCVAAAAGRAANAAFGLTLISLPAYRLLALFTGYAFMVVTLEFVLRFTGSPFRRTVRAVQIVALIALLVQLVGVESLGQTVGISAETALCIVVTILLFKAWQHGRGDAGAMLLPFFLAASADLIEGALNFAAARHWLPQRFASPSFHIGPIAYSVGNVTDLIFLSSLIAVILYRFIRVSQEEQRSAAEIAAAQSVQSLLIPTHLPSNRNFMLESAYLPVNGVGGDFFQVLPLKDDSLLIVVGDVSGKGLQAAMNSSTLVGALRNELSHDPVTVLEHLNRVLIGAVASPGAVQGLDCAPCFATCLCARIYPDGTTTIANAGHLSPYRDGREVELTPSLPLGVIADTQFEQTKFQLNHGDRLVFLSDGVVEATNAHGELFGFERTQQVSNEPARYIAQTAKRFGQTDDITVVSLYLASRTAKRANEEVVYTN